MVGHRVNMCYSVRETVELVLNEASDLEDFSDSSSEENIVDSGEESGPADLEADMSDSDNNIFIFIIGIHATSRIKLFSTVFGQIMLCCCDREGIWHAPLKLLDPRDRPKDAAELANFGPAELNALLPLFGEISTSQGCDAISQLPGGSSGQSWGRQWRGCQGGTQRPSLSGTVFHRLRMTGRVWQHYPAIWHCTGTPYSPLLVLREASPPWTGSSTDYEWQYECGNIIQLSDIVLVLPLSTAGVEGGFTTMKRIKSDWRSKFNTSTVSQQMCISTEGPDTCKYNCLWALQRCWEEFYAQSTSMVISRQDTFCYQATTI